MAGDVNLKVVFDRFFHGLHRYLQMILIGVILMGVGVIIPWALRIAGIQEGSISFFCFVVFVIGTVLTVLGIGFIIEKR